MNKVSTTDRHPLSSQEPEGIHDSDDFMLDEYDFSQGTRNKYAHRYQQNQQNRLPGVRFVTDAAGKKIGALLDLRIHQSLWHFQIKDKAVSDFNFLTNSQGEQLSVFIEFESHLGLWQQIYDALLAA